MSIGWRIFLIVFCMLVGAISGFVGGAVWAWHNLIINIHWPSGKITRYDINNGEIKQPEINEDRLGI